MAQKTNIIETFKFLIKQLIPGDNTLNDTDQQRNIRRLTEQTIETTNNRDFSQGVFS
jgi:uncharacterized protein (UPF0147 family)